MTATTDVMLAAKELVLVVGYDGSPPAQRALDQAARLMQGREGWLEVVYVARMPSVAPLAPQATAQLMQGFDEESDRLEREVDERLAGAVRAWHFRRRDGSVAAELLELAREFKDRYGDSKDIGLVVGGAAHRYHRLAGSVGASLARADRFPLVVVP